MKEVWKDLVGYDFPYRISNTGKIFSIKKNKLFKTQISKRGYSCVVLYKNGKPKNELVHRLVAKYFIGDSNGLQVNHKDGNKLNNCVLNLEYLSNNDNRRHAYINKLHNIRPVNQLDCDGNFIKHWESATLVSRELGISKEHICSCCRGFRKHAGGYKWEYNDNHVFCL